MLGGMVVGAAILASGFALSRRKGDASPVPAALAPEWQSTLEYIHALPEVKS